jgi:hypothetical protein
MVAGLTRRFLRDAHHANTAAQMPHHNHGAPGSSPPVTPRSLSFLSPNMGTAPTNAVNPLSPPASVRSFSFSVSPEQNAAGVINPFASPGSTRASSLVDVPCASCSISSRSNSANSPASRQSGIKYKKRGAGVSKNDRMQKKMGASFARD